MRGRFASPILAAAAGLGALAGAGAASAQETAPPADEPVEFAIPDSAGPEEPADRGGKPPEKRRSEVRLALWYAAARGGIESDDPMLTADWIPLRDLGVGDYEWNGFLDASFAVSRRHAIALELLYAGHGGREVLSQTLNFDGITFPAGAGTSTFIDLALVTGLWRLTASAGARAAFDLEVGFNSWSVEGRVRSPAGLFGTRGEISIEGFQLVLGVVLTVRLGYGFELEGGARMGSFWDSGDRSSLLDGRLGTRLALPVDDSLPERLQVSVGYRYLWLSAEEDHPQPGFTLRDEVELNYWGPWLGAVVRF
ncbi:MAG: hypothetical protein L0216_20455 [Planctomycetales bacterium]|nr:hypothetical protein [Planctomycetales bacterium]